jgi:hypothetical protein
MHSKHNKGYGKKRETNTGLPQYSIVALGEKTRRMLCRTSGVGSFHLLRRARSKSESPAVFNKQVYVVPHGVVDPNFGHVKTRRQE